MAELESALVEAQNGLRAAHVWPLPRNFPAVTPPAGQWKSWAQLIDKQLPMRHGSDYRKLVGMLNQLNSVRHIAFVTGCHNVAANVDRVVEPFQQADRIAAAAAAEEARRLRATESKVDEFGRVYAIGRRKTSSARVWLVPTEQAREVFAKSPESAEESASASAEASDASAEPKPVAIPQSEILINHLPLPTHFSRVVEREAILRPFRVTGLLGAYNVFALVRGGGASGQAGAVSLAIARALAQIRPDASPALGPDGALYRDPRVVERKHTNRVKARKAVSIVEADDPHVICPLILRLSAKFIH
jgi:small subunit ribosomal protein S9